MPGIGMTGRISCPVVHVSLKSSVASAHPFELEENTKVPRQAVHYSGADSAASSGASRR